MAPMYNPFEASPYAYINPMAAQLGKLMMMGYGVQKPYQSFSTPGLMMAET